MLGRTTSLLPNALFASLGMPREENLADVKHVSARPTSISFSDIYFSYHYSGATNRE